MEQTYLSPHDPSSHRLPAAKIVDSRVCDLRTPSPPDAYSRACSKSLPASAIS